MEKHSAQQETQAQENPTKKGIICVSCLSFFPLLYLVGKLITTLF